ncbi:MAG: hypothetical protein ACPHFO_01265, partial [Acidimicrobiales bacterium]
MRDPQAFIAALRRVLSAARVADLDGLDLRGDIESLVALAERLGTAAVDEPRMQAALSGSDMD